MCINVSGDATGVKRSACEEAVKNSANLMGGYTPQCTADGQNFEDTQCHGSTGYCWCVDASGNEIQGTKKAPGTGDVYCGMYAFK